jgi:solute carrier family 10 (sodium/bile acid cotransporter), member 7
MLSSYTFFKKNWFFVGIAVVVVLALHVPTLGLFVKEHRILNVGIFLTFLITGLSLDTRTVLEQIKNIRVLAAALLSSLLFIPMITAMLSRLAFPENPDFVVGSIIMAVAPVTVASGTVMTAMAMGNVPLSLFICVLCNFASLASIPLMLKLLLGMDQGITLPMGQILGTLAMILLIPTLLGQILRPWLKEVVAGHKKTFSIFSQCIVLLIIFNAVSSSTGVINGMGSGLVGLFLFMVLLHALILVLNLSISRIIRLDQSSTSAFTIHTSQKTLTISYVVWAGYFAHAFPLAMVPGIAYHLVQMIMDTVVAGWFKKMATRRYEAGSRPSPEALRLAQKRHK